MSVLSITKENYEQEVVQSDKPVLLDLWATWCIPCKALGKIVEEMSQEIDSVKMGKLNIEDCPEIAASLGVLSVPALIYFKDGKVVEKMSGVPSKKAIIKKLGLK